ncbi:MAG: hypothetical protein ACK5YI_03345 [Rhodospirillales bacterium]
MKRWIVDTNVPIVANGRPAADVVGDPSIDCREAAVAFLLNLERRQGVWVDEESRVVEEYRRHLSPSGQPGVGDRFYQKVLNDWRFAERCALPVCDDGEYVDLPRSLADARFDPSDRKFAALARRCRAPVANAVDSDWIEHGALLEAEGIRVEHLCGCDPAAWFSGGVTAPVQPSRRRDRTPHR